MTPSWSKIAVATGIACALGAIFYFDASQYLEFEYLHAQREQLHYYVTNSPLKAGLIYFSVYVAVTSLSLPGAAVLTLIGGAIFGLLWGTVLVSFASTVGATIAFLVSRHLFRDVVANKFHRQVDAIDQGINRDGVFYLLTMRLIPAFPYFMINLIMGLTGIKLMTFFVVSQIGMLPGTLIFVNAGTQIAKINAPGDVLSPALLGSLVLLGLFPLIAKFLNDWLKRRRVYAAYPRPQHFSHNVIVIGAGSGGLVAAYIAAASKAKVALIEQERMGGDCLNSGCVPSKALLRTAKAAAQMRHADRYGLESAEPEIDFATAMSRVERVIKTIEPHDSVERYTALGVDVVKGKAIIKTPFEVAVGDQTYSARSIIIAAGAAPFVPPIEGLEECPYYTSETLWSLRERPTTLVVLGGGPIGCELGQAFARLGSQVTLIEMAPRLLLNEDPDVAATMRQQLSDDGVDVKLGFRASKCARNEATAVVHCVSTDDESLDFSTACDAIIVAVGRKPRVEGYGLETLGIELNGNGTIATDEYLATNIPNVYAVGDVAGPYQFTHTASHQAWYATVNALFGTVKRFAADYTVIPWCTFTDPEIARVGLNESEAAAQDIPFEATTYDLGDSDRAIADGEASGFIRVLTPPGGDTILGVTIVAPRAGDLIAEFVLAMRHGLGLKKILGTIHIYPTLNEANKAVAGSWQREHTPGWALSLSRRFHEWRLR